MERRKGATKKMDQLFEIEEQFFILILDVKSAGGFDETVYFACTEGIFQVKYKFNSIDSVFGVMLITTKVNFHVSIFKKNKK